MSDMNWRQLDIRLYAVVASLVISGIIFLPPFAHTPNDDAFTYIRTADIFLNEGLAAAFQHYTWASYAVLIGLTSKLGIGLFPAAHLINALFYALLVFSFVSIAREMHTSRLLLALSAVVILVYPQLNEYRTYVIRDTGFWALALLALWQFLLFARSGVWYYATGFCCALLLATALRPEALFYLLVTPIALLFDRRYAQEERRRRLLQLVIQMTGIGVVALVVLAMGGINIITLLTEFVSVYKPFLANTFTPDPTQTEAIGNVLFGEYAASFSREYIGMFMAAGLLTILFANLFNSIGGPYLWVLVYGAFQKQLQVTRAVAMPVLLYMLTNALVLLGFLLITRYLTSRYAIMFSLMLVLVIPQLLAYYLHNKSAARRRSAIVVLSVFLTYCAFDSYITFGDSKRYVYDAIAWVETNSEDSTALVTNNHAVAYYSGKVVDYDKTVRNLTAADILQTAHGDLVVIESNFAMEQLLRTPAIAAALEQVLVLPSAEDVQLVILRRANP